MRLLSTGRSQQPARHLGRKEARRNSVNKYMSGAQLNRQIARKMQHRRLTRRIAKRRVRITHTPNANPCHRACNKHPGRILKRSTRLQQRRKPLNRIEDSLHVEVHDFCKGRIRVGVEAFAPCSTGVGKQDVNVVSVLADFRY